MLAERDEMELPSSTLTSYYIHNIISSRKLQEVEEDYGGREEVKISTMSYILEHKDWS